MLIILKYKAFSENLLLIRDCCLWFWLIDVVSVAVRPEGLQRDVVYPAWPIAPSYTSPNAGRGWELRGVSQWVQLCTGAQVNFGDLTPYLTYDSGPCEQGHWPGAGPSGQISRSHRQGKKKFNENLSCNPVLRRIRGAYPGSRVKKAPDPGSSRKIFKKTFLTQKIVTKL